MDASISTHETYHSKYGDAPKLTTTNYHAWSKSITYILRAAQAWRIITGEELPPEAPTANANNTARDRYEDKRDRYNSRYDIAAATIYQSCSTTLQGYIAVDSNPQEMWQTLKDRVDNTSNNDGPTLLRERLHKERFNGEGSISTFISKVLTYREQLAHTTQALTDNEIVSHLITNLPSSWRIIRTIISNQPAASKTLNYTINALVNYETELQDDKNEEQPATNALVATTGHKQSRGQGGWSQGRGRIEKPSRNPERNQVRCWYCLRPGHKERDCRLKKEADEEREKRASTRYAEAGIARVEPF
jgi:hypothetical protein